MADFPLLLKAPNRAWAEHVGDLMQQGLGEHGSVQLNLPLEEDPDAPSTPGYDVTGIAVCDEPEDEMLQLITSKLGDYQVDTSELSGQTQIIVAPQEDAGLPEDEPSRLG